MVKQRSMAMVIGVALTSAQDSGRLALFFVILHNKMPRDFHSLFILFSGVCFDVLLVSSIPQQMHLYF